MPLNMSGIILIKVPDENIIKDHTETARESQSLQNFSKFF